MNDLIERNAVLDMIASMPDITADERLMLFMRCQRIPSSNVLPEPPKDHPAPICQTCGNFETCPWRHEGIFSGPKDKARRVVACSDYKDKKG